MAMNGKQKRKTGAEYDRRTRKVKRMYGKGSFKRWGKLGGNPVLLKGRAA
jgi:hypothetical protein